MEFCSYFIDNLALFGRYPSQEFVDLLGDEYTFIDLTNSRDSVLPYVCKNKISFPIEDKSCPTNVPLFCKFILQVLKLLQDGNKIYVHCRGGHGRAGIVVWCLLKLFYDISVEDALKKTNECHNRRPFMRDKWRKMGCPQNYKQKNFVRQLFELTIFNIGNENNYFSNYYPSRIKLYMNGEQFTFLCAHSAYAAFKIDDVRYRKLISQETDIKIVSSINNRIDDMLYDDKKYFIMKYILREKFRQNPDMLDKLLNTGFAKIVKFSTRRDFWNDMCHNRMGRLLEEIRTEFM